MEKQYRLFNDYGNYVITIFCENGIPESATVHGCKAAAAYDFKRIHRRPPNDYGNFYGREKAGLAACLELTANLTPIKA